MQNSPKLIYTRFSICSGTAEDDQSSIVAFDRALMRARIHQYNLVGVSSMLCTGASRVAFDPKVFETGEIVFCVLARVDGRKGESIFAGLSYAIGSDVKTRERYGFVFEGHSRTSTASLRAQLATGVRTMARYRNFKVGETQVFATGINTIAHEYGCAVVALVYLK